MNRAAIKTYTNDRQRARLPYDPAQAKPWRAVCRYLAPWVDPGAGLLDLGAGRGDLSRFSKAFPKWALDTNPDLIRYWPENVEPLIQSPLDPLPFWGASLGTIFAANLFQRFTAEQGGHILQELRRVLRQSGRLIVIQSNCRLVPRSYFDDYARQTIFTDKSFNRFLAASGFRVIHSEPRFTPFTLKSGVSKTEWMMDLYLQLPFRPFAGQFLAIAEPDHTKSSRIRPASGGRDSAGASSKHGQAGPASGGQDSAGVL